MKLAFRLSLVANVALLAAVATLLWREPAATGLTPAKTSVAPSAAGEASLPSAAPSPPASAPSVPAALAQLGQAGVPRDVLVNVLLEDLNRRTNAKLLALQKQYAPKAVPERELRALSRQSTAEQAQSLRAALGEEGYRAWDKEQALHALNRARPPGDELAMSDAEAEQAYRLQKAFDEEYRGLQEAMEDGVADRADAGALQAQAQQKLDRELEKLLGPQRFGQLKGGADPTTEVFRTYGELNPTSAQAHAVVQAEADYRARQAELAQRLTADPAAAATLATELRALNEAQDASLRQIFGAAAYEAVKRQNDPTYQTLRQYADAWQLQDHEVQSVYQALRSLRDQAELARSAASLREAVGQAVNWPELNLTLAQAQQRTESGLQTLLGGERLRRLKQNGLLGP